MRTAIPTENTGLEKYQDGQGSWTFKVGVGAGVPLACCILGFGVFLFLNRRGTERDAAVAELPAVEVRLLAPPPSYPESKALKPKNVPDVDVSELEASPLREHGFF